MTVDGILRFARSLGVDRLDARRLVAECVGQTPTWVIAHPEATLPPDRLAGLQQQLQRRAAGVPLAYLVGRREFHGLDLAVDDRVLDPRPDTETLVDAALGWLADRPTREGRLQVLDLGTGSGAIALALARARPDLSVWAVDRSPRALEVARANGLRLGLPVAWRLGHWWQPWRAPVVDDPTADPAIDPDAAALDGSTWGPSQPVPPGAFDLVVSNPPYLAADDPHLPALAHEPREALVAPDADGLGDVRAIVQGAAAHLRRGGALLLEHGHTQGPAVAELMRRAGAAPWPSLHDLAGHWRCTGGTFA